MIIVASRPKVGDFMMPARTLTELLHRGTSECALAGTRNALGNLFDARWTDGASRFHPGAASSTNRAAHLGLGSCAGYGRSRMGIAWPLAPESCLLERHRAFVFEAIPASCLPRRGFDTADGSDHGAIRRVVEASVLSGGSRRTPFCQLQLAE